jgi:hypothetical protein
MYLFYVQQLKWSNPFFMLTISRATGLHCPAGVKLIEPTPSGQHVVVIPQTGDPQLWHVMSNSLTHTFKGTLLSFSVNDVEHKLFDSLLKGHPPFFLIVHL